MIRTAVASAIITLVALAADTAGAAAPAADVIAADTPLSTSAGATFTAPAGWAYTARDNLVVLTPPERDSNVVLVDTQASDPDGTVAAAWKAFRPSFRKPLKLKVQQAPGNGWEERHFYEYETSPNERRAIQAFAWRAGKNWIGIIVAGSEPTLEKRASPVNLIVQSLRPKGYQRETFAAKKPHAIDSERVGVMKAFVANGMRQLGIPGVAFSLIDRGQVVFEGGFGVRELGKPPVVDARTLFPAASNTKGLTTLLLAQLVDEKKMGWDQPVIDLYPAFRLGDAATTRRVLVKHLICACTGMPRQDLEWIFEFGHATPATALTLLGTMQPTSAFGEVFQYSNLLAAAAGYVAAAIAYPGKELGAAYDEAMSSRIFLPLGMTQATFDFARAQRGNHARPHADDLNGTPTLAPMDLNYAVVAARPAGGVWTSVHDLSKYVQMELAGGKLPDGRRLVSERNLLARRHHQVTVSEDLSYGMGLLMDMRWGIPVIHHGGALAGYRSDMIWLPDHDVGAVILANSESAGALLGPFLRRLLELLFDGKPEAEEQLAGAASQRNVALAKKRERLTVPASKQEVARLADRYRSTDLGTIVTMRGDGGTVFDVGEWRSQVGSRVNDDGSISFVTIDPTSQDLDFVVGAQGGKRTLTLRDAQHEYVFIEDTDPSVRVRR